MILICFDQPSNSCVHPCYDYDSAPISCEVWGQSDSIKQLYNRVLRDKNMSQQSGCEQAEPDHLNHVVVVSDEGRGWRRRLQRSITFWPLCAIILSDIVTTVPTVC